MKRRSQVWLSIGVLAALVSCSIPEAGALTLAENGKPAEYKLVCPEGASPSQKYAAEEFRKFVAQMTGVALPIVSDKEELPAKGIFFGVTRQTAGLLKAAPDVASLGEDGFRIKACPPHLLVIGGPVRGTLYGAYEILERFGGCRWYSSWHSVIPSVKKFDIPDDWDNTQKPAFAMREPFWYDMFDGDFAARCRANGNAMRLEARHGGHSFRFGGDLPSCHTFARLVPVSEFYAKHPEYFALRNGRRDNRADAQLCLTNPDVLKLVIERVKERIRQDPGARFYGVSQNDNCEYCTCPACQAIDDREESHAGTMVAFINAVAEAVEKDFPSVKIETLAYQYTRKPPKTLRLRKNVVPCLCTIECDFSFGIGKSAFRENRSFLNDIAGWAGQAPELYVWDYTTDFSHYTAPFPNVLALQDNIKFFRANRVNELFEQGAYQGRHGDFAELKAWLLAKWMWNPDLPAEPLLEDFFNGYYGKAAPEVRTYFDALHSFFRDPAEKPLRIFINVTDPAIPDDFYDRAIALWRQAEEAVRDSAPVYRYNVRMGEFPVLYARLMRAPGYTPKQVWITRHPDSPRFQAPPAQRALAAELLARMDEAKDIRLSELKEANQARIAAWRKLLARGNPPAKASEARATIEDKLITIGKEGTWASRVADPSAEDHSAIQLANTHYEWCLTFNMDAVAYDCGVNYKLRARVRVEKEPGAKGNAFWLGVYDPQTRRGISSRTVTNEEIKGDGYVWYDVADWQPSSGQYFWMGPGMFDSKHNQKSAVRGVYLDKLELVRQ